MTNEQHKNPRISRDADGWSLPVDGGDGMQCRMIGAGAAWTLPVVAVAVATPAAAVSQKTRLAYTKDSYRGKACETINNVQVRRTGDASAPVSGDKAAFVYRATAEESGDLGGIPKELTSVNPNGDFLVSNRDLYLDNNDSGGQGCCGRLRCICMPG